MARVFISYSKKDKARLKSLQTVLEYQGHHVWWDDQLRSNDNFREIIERHLAGAEAVIVIWTPNSAGSKWVRAEAKAALDHGKLLNIRFDAIKTDLLPDFVRAMHIESFEHWDEQNKFDPAVLKLNEAIAQRKTEADRARISEALGPALHVVGEKLGISKILFDFGLPGGLRVYRLLAGSVAMTALVWGLLYFAQLFDDDGGMGLEWSGLLLIFGFVLLVRSLHQLRHAIVAGELQRYVDRFFESDFAYCTVVSTMIGVIFALSFIIINGYDTVFNLTRDAVYGTGMSLLIITVARLSWAVWIELNRRID
jgi:hypothetical protein